MEWNTQGIYHRAEHAEVLCQLVEGGAKKSGGVEMLTPRKRGEKKDIRRKGVRKTLDVKPNETDVEVKEQQS